MLERQTTNESKPNSESKPSYQTPAHGILTIDQFYSSPATIPPFFRLDLGSWTLEQMTLASSSSKRDTGEASSIWSRGERRQALTCSNFSLASFIPWSSKFSCLIINMFSSSFCHLVFQDQSHIFYHTSIVGPNLKSHTGPRFIPARLSRARSGDKVAAAQPNWIILRGWQGVFDVSRPVTHS